MLASYSRVLLVQELAALNGIQFFFVHLFLVEGNPVTQTWQLLGLGFQIVTQAALVTVCVRHSEGAWKPPSWSVLSAALQHDQHDDTVCTVRDMHGRHAPGFLTAAASFCFSIYLITYFVLGVLNLHTGGHFTRAYTECEQYREHFGDRMVDAHRFTYCLYTFLDNFSTLLVVPILVFGDSLVHALHWKGAIQLSLLEIFEGLDTWGHYSYKSDEWLQKE